VGTTAFETLIEQGRHAVARRAWPAGFEALSRADVEGVLEPDDLEALGKAAYWDGRPTESIEADERAYAAYVERGDHERAAFLALKLRRQHAMKRSGSVAKGWLGRAEKLLEDRPESLATGYLAIAHGELALDRGELDYALEHVERALTIAERSDDRDLLAWAVMRKGMVLVSMGRLDDGWSLMEEVAAAAAGGELGAYTTGAVFCNVVSMSRDMADYTRAREWSDAARRWCERQAITGFPGVCRVHRAEVMRLIGAWDEAEAEGRRATVELKDFNPVYAGMAFHELGEVRLRMGDLAAAEEAFHQAHELGEDPQPGLALLRLAQGKADAAASSIGRSLDELTWDKLARARLLPAKAEIARARGDAASARAAGEELDAIASEFDTTAIHAGADWAHGLADLTGGEASDAARRLRRARQRWQEVDCPYEAARAGVFLAEAFMADGDREAAAMELRSAQTAFERLGAVSDGRHATERLEHLRRPAERAVARRTFVFTDIVGSTALLEAIGDQAWGDLRRWHDETLRACLARHDGEEVDHTGDGFFLAFPDADAAVACAREIQQELADHRRLHGFAPQVRIGLHAAEATLTDGNYTGMGVHTAARVGAVAGAGEIVATSASIAGLDALDLTDRRSVALKGIAEPVEIVSIGWR
jgi:class 3 adenylate cyclase/predicted negative regulator of RcsB-dependent stress response